MAEYRKDEAKDWAREFLRGQWTTLMTVFTSDDEVDEEGMRANMRHVRSLGTRGGGCTWGMGEFSALTREERLKVYDIVADEAGGEWPIAAHVTHTSAKEMTALAEHAEGVGFDLLILAPPYMVTRTEDQVVEWTKLLADSTSLAIMFYNSPQFGIVMSGRGNAPHLRHSECGRRKGSELQSRPFDRDAPATGPQRDHQHTGRVDLLQGQGTRI